MTDNISLSQSGGILPPCLERIPQRQPLEEVVDRLSREKLSKTEESPSWYNYYSGELQKGLEVVSNLLGEDVSDDSGSETSSSNVFSSLFDFPTIESDSEEEEAGFFDNWFSFPSSTDRSLQGTGERSSGEEKYTVSANTIREAKEPENIDPVEKYFNLCKEAYAEKTQAAFPLRLQEFKELYISIISSQTTSARKVDEFIRENTLLELIGDYQLLPNKQEVSLENYCFIAINYGEENVDGPSFAKGVMELKLERRTIFFEKNLCSKNMDFIKEQKNRYKKWYGGVFWNFLYSFTAEYKFFDKIVNLPNDIKQDNDHSSEKVLERLLEQVPEILYELQGLGITKTVIETKINEIASKVASLSLFESEHYAVQTLKFVNITPEWAFEKVAEKIKQTLPFFHFERFTNGRKTLYEQALSLEGEIDRQTANNKLKKEIKKISYKVLLRSVQKDWLIRKINESDLPQAIVGNSVQERIAQDYEYETKNIVEKIFYYIKWTVVQKSPFIGKWLAVRKINSLYKFHKI